MKRSAIVSVLSYPKVNLTLDIFKKDKSGYHEIQTIFHQLKEPVDEIILEELRGDKIEIACDNPKVPLDKTNTVFKAAALFKKRFSLTNGARIFIKKKIPFMSGLGGGSSNAVAALRGLARLWCVECQCVPPSLPAPHLRWSKGDEGCNRSRSWIRQAHHDTSCPLCHFADQIGMDCAFFFCGGTALGEHFGEKITPLPDLPENIKFEIIETGIEVSSHDAYQQVDLAKCGKNAGKTKKLIRLLRAQKSLAGDFCALLHNDFEEFIFTKYPILLKKKIQIESAKSGRVLLCGSGGCMIRIYEA